MSIFSNPQVEAHLNHNIFDVSPRHVFSLDAGMLTGFRFIHTVPNAVYDLTCLDTIELNGMPKANFGRMSQQIDYFFVPYSQLWKPFDSMYYRRLDNVRNPGNVRNPLLPTEVPTFDYWNVVTELFTCYVVCRIFDRLRAEIGGSAQYDHLPASISLDQAISAFEVDYPNLIYLDVHGRWCIEDMIRNFDLMGYGNLLPFFQKAFKLWVIRSYTDPTQGNFDLDDFIEAYYADCEAVFVQDLKDTQWGDLPEANSSLYDYIYNYVLNPENQDADVDNLMQAVFPRYASYRHGLLAAYFPNAWSILAYLKIYNDYYKSMQYDDENYAYFYNQDWITDPSSQRIPMAKVLECLKPRYHLYKRDMFTGGYPNSQFGNVAVVLTDQEFHKLISNYSSSSDTKTLNAGQVYSSGSAVVQKGTAGSASINADKYKFDPALYVSVLAMRQATAMQKWKEKNLRAGNRLHNQQSAFFGDRSRYIEDEYVREIGNTYTPIMINNVTAQADSSLSDGARVGDKASSGSSSHSNNVVDKFESHDFGVIVGIMYILPESEYEAFGFDPGNIRVQADDYFMPDFQNLGLEAVPNILFNLFGDHNSIINYLSRYYGYKTAVSKVHGEFNQDGAFADYVTPRRKQDLEDLTLSSLQVAPFDIDNLFYQKSSWYQADDKFKVNMNVIGKFTLPMSVTGLPY